jgi:hypothetical protein
MAAKITLVTGETIRVDYTVDDVVSEVNAALASASLLSMKGERGRVVWINPAQIVRIDGGRAAEGGWRASEG